MVTAIKIVSAAGIYAQERALIKGILIDGKTRQAVPYAKVILIKASDSTLIWDTISDEEGSFNISCAPIGNYRLLVSVLGYKPVSRMIDVISKDVTDAGIIVIQDTQPGASTCLSGRQVHLCPQPGARVPLCQYT